MKDCRRILRHAINKTTYEIQDKVKQVKKKFPIFSTVPGKNKPLHSGMSPENCVRNFHVEFSSVMAKTMWNVFNF